MMMAILKFGGSIFVNFVFYDFYRGQLKPRVEGRGQVLMILLLCSAAVRLVNSFGNSLANLVFGLSILMVQMLLLFKDDGRRELFLLLVGEAVALFLELLVSLFFSRFPLWALLRESFGYDQEVEDYIMGILAYLLCWLVLHSLKLYFLSTKCAVREHFPLSFFILPLSMPSSGRRQSWPSGRT